MIETSDSISPDCLTAVGQYRGSRSENATANTSLLSQQFDSTDATNSEVQQLDLLNAAEAQKLSEMQSQGALHACLASQMTVANMERRNAAVKTSIRPSLCSGAAANDTSARVEHLADLPSIVGDTIRNFSIRRSCWLSSERYRQSAVLCIPAARNRKPPRPQQRRRPFLSNNRRPPRNSAGAMRRSGGRLRQDKKRHNSAAAKEGKTWKTYIP